MIETTRFTFAAPPKAGCRWIHGALKELGPVEHGSLHTPGRVDGKLALSIVRHPVDWLKSYFTNINCPVWHEPVDVFLRRSRGEREPDNEGLRRFIEKYLAGPPGSVGRMFESYAADVWWRIEDMPGPLEACVQSKLAFKARGESKVRLGFPEDLRAAVLDHEREFSEEWGYA